MSNDFNAAFNRILARQEAKRQAQVKKLRPRNLGDTGTGGGLRPGWREGNGFIPKHASWNIREFKGTAGKNHVNRKAVK